MHLSEGASSGARQRNPFVSYFALVLRSIEVTSAVLGARQLPSFFPSKRALSCGTSDHRPFHFVTCQPPPRWKNHKLHRIKHWKNTWHEIFGLKCAIVSQKGIYVFFLYAYSTKVTVKLHQNDVNLLFQQNNILNLHIENIFFSSGTEKLCVCVLTLIFIPVFPPTANCEWGLLLLLSLMAVDLV